MSTANTAILSSGLAARSFSRASTTAARYSLRCSVSSSMRWTPNSASCTSVSYTHLLDAPRDRGMTVTAHAEFLYGEDRITPSGPVSYTHLVKMAKITHRAAAAAHSTQSRVLVECFKNRPPK